MGEQFVTVHRSRPTDTEILAVIHAPETITGTADPALVRTIRAALDNAQAIYEPLHRGDLRGPARDHTGLDWALVVLGNLYRAGLRGDAVGFTWPEPEPDYPDRDY